MASIYQTFVDDASSQRRKASSTRTSGKRKVYGKRKIDAPRAVFEQRSPAKVREITEVERVQDAVASLETKLARVRITESIVEKNERENYYGETIHYSTESSSYISDGTPGPVQVPLADSAPIAETPQKSAPITSKKHQTMVEVRITPRVIPDEPRGQTNGSPTESSSSKSTSKRNTKKEKSSRRVSSDYVSNEKVTSYVRSILNESMSPVAAQGIQRFDAWAARAGEMLEVVKLAEGSYGEVYKLKLRGDVCEKEISKSKLVRLRAYGDGVFKVVPLRAQSGPGSKKFTSIEEIVAEIKMLKYLDPIPGFARFREIHVVQGRFPKAFQEAWDQYKKTKDDCLNPNPSSKRAYPDSQIWGIVEMDDAGCELEKFSWSSIFQVYDIFWGVAMALARAEEYALFEHRDLHLGNVCIRSARPDGCMNPPSDLEIMHQSYSSGFGLSTLETTLIDYSLSRAELVIDEAAQLVETTSSDLDKKQIFDAIGHDEDDALLRDTYRHMRAQLYSGDPLNTEKTPDVPGIWAEYAPRTNLVWLRFLLKMLLKNRKPETRKSAGRAMRQPLAPCTPNRDIRKAVKSGKKRETGQEMTSAEETYDKVSQLKQTLEDRLNAILELLDLEHGDKDMCCTADLVAFALDAQWLDERDFSFAE
ncbi:hypothetical protein ASPCAL06530 [Aspergillus calidoustus]|uniref:non-specific serine/threonine protein kinase n=1 Tax=Aspergillus calidoustus TaxID=454130 RepID=A0A0U5GWK0_ASPCI|nr:hypothetical protein ASPCAL06530 [Aspergillus calidoustus]